MDSVNKTLYIPLFGKAYISRRGILLNDPMAERIWAAEGFPLKGKSRSRWLACYMAMRAAVFDRWLREQLALDPAAAVVHIGCGMDNRCLRVDHGQGLWFDLDFPEVIRQRRRYYPETDRYKMLGSDVRSADWLSPLPGGNAVVVMEGVSMYLRPEELSGVLSRLREHFASVRLLMDCYTELAAKASRVRNPINDVGVTQVCGLNDPRAVEGSGLRFLCQRDMTPEDLIRQLPGWERVIFQTVFAGRFARKLYRLYEYEAGAL